MSAPATATGRRQAFSICIMASCSRPAPHWRYLMGSVRGGGGALRRALANSWRRGSFVKADGLAMIALTSCSKRDLSPPLRMKLVTKPVARRVASPSGTPRRIKSLVFIERLVRVGTETCFHGLNRESSLPQYSPDCLLIAESAVYLK